MITDQDKRGLFAAAELGTIETRFPDGISSQEVISLFQERGIKLSEATFRKYVQLGLLPTSRRVGSKGKHRGSRGIYPISVVRRINLLKQLMDEGLTLEEIRDSFLSVQNDVERISDAFEHLFDHMEGRLDRLRSAGGHAPPIARDLAAARKDARVVLKQIERIGSRLVVARPPSAGSD